ncbi:FAD-dependent oxidoreductase [Azohydromonas australica]|uniref:FAD-dependent oxidoreductase n=1 Tax=Azohydromonas australica TaxID=364039 RepID=UPI0003F4D420|nr:FAD-dependent oxidoreductase [Azohydromonas australica]
MTRKVLVVGGGIAGMCTAIELRKRGTHVDLVEIDPDWRVYGAGITLSGATLRALTEIGIIDDIMKHGWCADGLDILAADGTKISEIPTPRLVASRPDVPGGGGIMRPVLARILREHTLRSGAAVRCGTTFSSIEQDAEGVEVRFTDGRQERYDLVVGADGLMSKVRDLVFPDAPKPVYTGQGSWRAVVPRPVHITHATMCVGRLVKAGVNPVSKDEMYLYVTERRETAEFIDESKWADTLRGVLQEFGGLIGEIRDGLGAHSRILYRPFFAVLQPRPWHHGRVVMLGDAAHATTPHLASGAGIGVEDAIVLAQELGKAADIELALQSFTERRYERCRMVVENSIALGEMERVQAPKEEHQALMRQSLGALMTPI